MISSLTGSRYHTCQRIFFSALLFLVSNGSIRWNGFEARHLTERQTVTLAGWMLHKRVNIVFLMLLFFSLPLHSAGCYLSIYLSGYDDWSIRLIQAGQSEPPDCDVIVRMIKLTLTDRGAN